MSAGSQSSVNEKTTTATATVTTTTTTSTSGGASAMISETSKRYRLTPLGQKICWKVGPTDVGQILCLLSSKEHPSWTEQQIRDALAETSRMPQEDVDPETLLQHARMLRQLSALLIKGIHKHWISVNLS